MCPLLISSSTICCHQVARVGGLPNGIDDLWELMGSNPKTKFNWEMSRKYTVDPTWGHIPRNRFDRVYIRHSRNVNVKPVSFELMGIERDTCGSFLSDHMGILTKIDLLNIDN